MEFLICTNTYVIANSQTLEEVITIPHFIHDYLEVFRGWKTCSAITVQWQRLDSNPRLSGATVRSMTFHDASSFTR